MRTMNVDIGLSDLIDKFSLTSNGNKSFYIINYTFVRISPTNSCCFTDENESKHDLVRTVFNYTSVVLKLCAVTSENVAKHLEFSRDAPINIENDRINV